MMLARRVVGGIESAAESLLSGDESMTCTKRLIRGSHHCKSIFHLFNLLEGSLQAIGNRMVFLASAFFLSEGLFFHLSLFSKKDYDGNGYFGKEAT